MIISDDFIELITSILRTLIPYYLITNIKLKYFPEGLILSDIITILWITSNTTCQEMSIAKPDTALIFNILLIMSLNIMLIVYSIYNKNYLVLSWLIIPSIISIMKGLSCAIEDIMKSLAV